MCEINKVCGVRFAQVLGFTICRRSTKYLEKGLLKFLVVQYTGDQQSVWGKAAQVIGFSASYFV